MANSSDSILRPTQLQFRVLGAMSACGALARLDRFLPLEAETKATINGLLTRGLIERRMRDRKPHYALSPQGVTFSRTYQSCRRCGCTEDQACPGGCHWAEPFLCSACREEGRPSRRSFGP